MSRVLPLVAVLAYVLPTWSILKRFGKGRDELNLVAMKSEGLLSVSPSAAKDVAALLGTSWSSGELPLTASFSMRLPGRCRLDVSSPESSRVLSTVWANGKKRQEGGEWPGALMAVEQACALLALHSANDGESRVALEKHLAALKVDGKTTSLGRLGSTVATIIGDRAPGSPQLWVTLLTGSAERDRFVPVRVRFTDEKGEAWDVRFRDYGSPATGEWFPRILEVFKGDDPQLRLTMLSADGKANLEQTKF